MDKKHTQRQPGALIYRRFAEIYDLTSKTLAEDTWHHGILEACKSLRPSGATALDLGCGTGIGGRLMSELNLTDIFGLDASPEMLKLAIPYYSQVRCCDFRNLPMDLGEFDLIVSGFDTLNYLDESELGAVFHRCRRLLRNAESRLVFDYSSPTMLWDFWRDLTYDQDLGSGRSLRWKHSYRESEGTTTRIALIDGNNEYWSESHVQYTMLAAQVSLVALSAGLVPQTIRNLRSTDFSPEAHTHLFIFRPLIG